jgi:outer membrane protein with beta-barrel domain
VSRTLLALLLGSIVFSAAPSFAQNTGPGKLELTLVPGGWVSFAEPDTQPEPAFSQFLVGGTFTVNWSMVGIEAELFFAPGRSQDLEFGSVSRSQTTPKVVLDSVNLVVPLRGNNRPAVPYVSAGIGEVTIMRTADNVEQPDTETFTTGNFGGGVKWYGAGRWGFRGDYRFTLVRSKENSPGSFFGNERRKSHRFYGALLVNLIGR